MVQGKISTLVGNVGIVFVCFLGSEDSGLLVRVAMVCFESLQICLVQTSSRTA